MRNKKLIIASLFAGAGGLEIAACSTGKVRKIISTDSNPTFLETIKVNLPEHFPDVEHKAIVADARELSSGFLLEKLNNEIDVVMGGPPCDDFARYGLQRGMKGEKGPLIYEFARLVAEIKPKVFLFENVQNLAQQFKKYFKIFLSHLDSIGLKYEWNMLQACDFGAPTKRRRIIIIGSMDKGTVDNYIWPKKRYGQQSEQLDLFDKNDSLLPFVNVSNVLYDLPDIDFANKNEIEIFNHTGRKHRPKTIEHLKTVPQGKEVKKSFRYRAPWNDVCRSLTAGVDNNTKSYIHPIYHREMTVREYARIHGFPDSWKFHGTHHNGIKQVANAVPIQMGGAVWERLHYLFGSQF